MPATTVRASDAPLLLMHRPLLAGPDAHSCSWLYLMSSEISWSVLHSKSNAKYQNAECYLAKAARTLSSVITCIQRLPEPNELHLCMSSVRLLLLLLTTGNQPALIEHDCHARNSPPDDRPGGVLDALRQQLIRTGNRRPHNRKLYRDGMMQGRYFVTLREGLLGVRGVPHDYQAPNLPPNTCPGVLLKAIWHQVMVRKQ